jgi:hypothetical protein
VWYLSVATVALQALTSLALLARELRRKLAVLPASAGDPAVPAPSAGP